MVRKRLDARIKIGKATWYLHASSSGKRIAKNTAKKRRETGIFARVVKIGNMYAVYERITSPTTGKSKRARR